MIQFYDVRGGESVTLRPRRLVIAGFAARNRSASEAHIGELAALGVPVPERTPSFYTLDPGLLTTADRIEVTSASTSGEVEPVVLIDAAGTRWLTVGSDHTDRDLERASIERSKAACPKVVATGAIEVGAAADWDGIRLASWADDVPYQVGTLSELLPLDVLLAEALLNGIEVGAGDVLFLGTVPVIGGALRPAASFRAEMGPPDRSWRVELGYSVAVGEGAVR